MDPHGGGETLVVGGGHGRDAHRRAAMRSTRTVTYEGTTERARYGATIARGHPTRILKPLSVSILLRSSQFE